MTDHIARAERDIAAPPETVWDVLTDPGPNPEIMFGARIESRWRVGDRITWSGEWEGKAYEDHGEILEIEPGHILRLTHFSPLTGQEDVPENYHQLEYRLTPTASGTHVTLTQDNNPTAEAAEHSTGMWRSMLDGLASVAERA
ncbi:MAG: SRPBCC domain-containing protein [Mycetocola sp.]